MLNVICSLPSINGWSTVVSLWRKTISVLHHPITECFCVFLCSVPVTLATGDQTCLVKTDTFIWIVCNGWRSHRCSHLAVRFKNEKHRYQYASTSNKTLQCHEYSYVMFHLKRVIDQCVLFSWGHKSKCLECIQSVTLFKLVSNVQKYLIDCI